MAFVRVPYGIGICFNFTTAGQQWQICLVVRAANDPPTAGQLGDAVNSAYNAWASNGHNCVSLGTELRQITGTDLSQQGGPQSVRTVGEFGSVTGTGLPLNAAIVTTERTQLRGRSYRGRMYLSGLTTTQMNGENAVNTTFLTTLLGWWTALIAQFSPNNLVWVVASKQHNKVVTDPAVTTVVTSVTIDPYIDSQRRRLFGRGS